MIDYAEKRDFIRMPVRCPVHLQAAGADDQDLAELLDLSASGVHFVSRRAHEAGEQLRLTVTPGNLITPPLEADVSVVRCSEVENGYDVAATIDLVAPALYPDD